MTIDRGDLSASLEIYGGGRLHRGYPATPLGMTLPTTTAAFFLGVASGRR